MKHGILISLLFLLSLGASANQVTIGDDEFDLPDQTLQVAVRVGSPFVMERADGSYGGITIELWERIADQLGLDYEYQPAELEPLLSGMREMQYDVGLGPLTVTAERERVLDFSQPFHNAGLAIALRQQDTPGWWAVSKRFFTTEFASVMVALAAILLLSGILLWIFERKYNSEEFSPDPIQGIGSGFWWAAVTMTTVGYGDKSPRTLGGRVISLIWMFTSVIIISSFTASIASSLTVNQLATKIEGPGELDRVRVGTLPNSFTSDYLDQRFITYQTYATLSEALEGLADDEVDAVVYDAPLLSYQMRQRFGSDLMLLPNTFMPQNYALTLTEGSELVEPVNRVLLDITSSAEWQRLLDNYLGN